MGKKAPSAKELLEKAAAGGYQPGIHREKDVIKKTPKYVQKTLKDQNWSLDRYVKWTEVTGIRGRIKDKTTVNSVKTFAEWFFAGFTRVTGTVISKDYRNTIYEWVRTVLTEEGLVVNTRKPKHLFGKHDLIQFHTTFWTKDDTSFVHPCNKIQIPFIVNVFYWTGAKIGAFSLSPDNVE
ncbi:MAG: hypothetical protein M1839_004906 [Geoglossum umbratile]|nr:MAG: hypothetical protein M1839_004906 [Geoglossum umbratile]